MKRDPARILIADDHTLFRAGLARLLSEDPRITVVSEAADGLETVRKCGEVFPDVVLMDLKMPHLDGVRATEQIVAAYPNIAILILTSLGADSYVLEALRAGASGYVLKDAEPEALISSVMAIRSGDWVIASAAIQRVLGMSIRGSRPRDLYDGLTGRELEILRLIASGSANKEIAGRLSIREETVRNHISKMYKKLRIFNRSQAVLYAARKGLVEL